MPYFAFVDTNAVLVMKIDKHIITSLQIKNIKKDVIFLSVKKIGTIICMARKKPRLVMSRGYPFITLNVT
jgi:hypothetical protein